MMGGVRSTPPIPATRLELTSIEGVKLGLPHTFNTFSTSNPARIEGIERYSRSPPISDPFRYLQHRQYLQLRQL